MSLDLFLRIKQKPNIKEIEAIIFPLGWKAWEYENEYFWYHEQNYESTRGAWLYLSEPSEDDPKDTKLVFSVNSKAGRSWEDLNAFNNVIRELRKKFGGSIWNPQTGKQSYEENDIIKLSSLEKACGFCYGYFQDNISRARFAVDKLNPELQSLKELTGIMHTMDSGLIRNNLILVFLIGSLETFLKDFFINYINCSPEIQEKIFEKRKIEGIDVKRLILKEITIAEYEAEQFTFQNLQSANKAYKEYLGIDLFKILGQRKKIGNKYYILFNFIEEALKLRHKIVHATFLEENLDENKVLSYIKGIELIGKVFVNDLLVRKKLRIDLDEFF